MRPSSLLLPITIATICIFMLSSFNKRNDDVHIPELRKDGFYNTYDTSFIFTYPTPKKSDTTLEKISAFLRKIGLARLDTFKPSLDNRRMNEMCQTIDMLIFLDEERVCYDHNKCYSGMPDFQCEFFTHDAKKVTGHYKIVGDSIYADVTTRFRKNGYKNEYLQTHYSGYIKNRDTILGWKIVPPYPKVSVRFNNDYVKDTAPKTLYFVKYERVAEVDDILKQ